jgi:hypothetical protein
MARLSMDMYDAVAAQAVEMPAEAYYEMGLAHACGRSQPIDLVAAHKWFNVALMKGCKAAAERRAELAGEMSAEEIATALREARAFVTKH